MFFAGKMPSEWGSEWEKETAAEQELGEEEEVQKVNLWEKNGKQHERNN